MPWKIRECNRLNVLSRICVHGLYTVYLTYLRPCVSHTAFIDALTRYRVENTPVDEVYLQVGQLFGKIGRIDLLDEFFMLHMPQVWDVK